MIVERDQNGVDTTEHVEMSTARTTKVANHNPADNATTVAALVDHTPDASALLAFHKCLPVKLQL